MPEEKKAEKKEERVKAGEITNIRIWRDRQAVRFAGWDDDGVRLTEKEENERFPTFGSAKRVLHERYPQAQIR